MPKLNQTERQLVAKKIWERLSSSFALEVAEIQNSPEWQQRLEKLRHTSPHLKTLYDIKQRAVHIQGITAAINTEFNSVNRTIESSVKLLDGEKNWYWNSNPAKCGLGDITDTIEKEEHRHFKLWLKTTGKSIPTSVEKLEEQLVLRGIATGDKQNPTMTIEEIINQLTEELRPAVKLLETSTPAAPTKPKRKR